jgi:hypothetical protein
MIGCKAMFIDESSYGNDASDSLTTTILSQSSNFSVHANQTVQLECLIMKQAPNTVVIWNQCDDPDCNQVRNPLTINKDNFIQDLRFRVLYENQKLSQKKTTEITNDLIEDSSNLIVKNKLSYRNVAIDNSLRNDVDEQNGELSKWTLEIRKFSKKDEGCYQCQLNSFQTKTIHYCLHLQSNFKLTFFFIELLIDIIIS